MKTAVIYARYSCDKQTEQSIEGQLRVCKEYAEKNKIVILKTYIDQAMTGTNENRPDFQQMIKDSNNKEWDYVIVYKLDRFSRDKYATAIYKKKLRDNGIKVLSAMENIPDTPEGIILESLLEGMNQYYSAELSQKVKRGMKQLRLNGFWQGGHLPYGYKVVEKKIVIDEFQAKLVNDIFTFYANGLNLRTILERTNYSGAFGTDLKLAKSSLHRMLRNKKYTGSYYHNEELVDNMYPRIISDELFNKVQKN